MNFIEELLATNGVPSLQFELDGVEGSMEEMDVAEVGVDVEVDIGPLGIFVSADQEFEGEPFENETILNVE